MIWLLVAASVGAYISVGLMVGGAALIYIRHLDDYEAAVIVLLWPLAILVGGLMVAARKVSHLMGSWGTWK